MKTKATICGILIGVATAKAEPVTDKLLDALAWAESNNNPDAEGKAGECGRWQMTGPAIFAVHHWRASMGDYSLEWTSFKRDANDREVARDWLLLCNIWFYKQTGRMPNLEELICVHNAPQLFKKRHWNLLRMPAATRNLIKRVEQRMKGQ